MLSIGGVDQQIKAFAALRLNGSEVVEQAKLLFAVGLQLMQIDNGVLAHDARFSVARYWYRFSSV
jgi:hypothetical protein